MPLARDAALDEHVYIDDGVSGAEFASAAARYTDSTILRPGSIVRRR
jgi:hypothetical protein